MNKKLIRKMLNASGGPLFPWQLNTEWVNDWKFRTTPASRSKVLSGKGVETDKQYTERRKKEETKRTWKSDAADIAHGIGEGVLALNPYTAIPYFGAKVGQDALNGNVSWQTALNASVPLFHLAPQAVGLREATNVALEDAANAGSKTARNWRVAREIKLATKNKPNMEVPKPIIRTKVGDVEINNPGLYYHQSDAGKAKNFVSTGRMRTPLEESWLAKEEAGEHIPIKIRSGIVPGYPQDPGSAMFAQGNLWYGLTTNKPDLLVTAREMPIANKNASVMSNKASLRQLEAQGTRRVTNDNIYTQGPHNRQNTTAYTWVPRYGYKKVTQEPSTSLAFFERKPSTIQISPEELYKVFKDQELNGYYFMGHGTGRTNVNPLIIFDNGLRIKNGDIGNTTSPISLSNLSLWPHANSKEIIILPGKAESVKFDSARGRIPSDWYDGKTFQWDDNPGFEGSGFFAVLKPNATFIETEINGVPGVYTKPEAILGSYNIDTQTLKLNPKSLYKFFKKQGGKMNILEFLKKGGGIHIKEKNKGKFTSYCGGKVTDECIQKGKNSSNPAIRKRAVFALNARHFKHKKGGTVKALEGTKFNWGSAIGNLASTALLLGISTYMLNKKLSSDAEADKEKYKSEAASKLQKDMQDERTKRFNILNAIKGTSDNPNAFGGGIFENYFINLGDNEAIRNYNQSISDYNKMIDLQIRAQKAENTGNFLSSLGLLGVGLLANSAFNKNSTNTSSASTSATSSTNTSYNLSNFWSTPSFSNYLSNLSTLYNSDKFWNMNPK